MNNLFGIDFGELPFFLIATVLAFTLHEFAHAYVADRFGDPTPRSMGRLSLNPRGHIDIMGILLVLLAGFGWAKPVLIRSSFFKKPRLASVLVSVAGPLSNLLLAVLGMLTVFLLAHFHAYDGMSIGVLKAVSLFLQIHILLNLGLFIFNLLPLPPLDGYRIIYEFLPIQWRERMRTFEQYAVLVFLVIVLIHPLYSVTLGPILDLRWDLLRGMNQIFVMLFGDQGQLSKIGILML
ncbi:site-2 protease family protein [Paenibacillus sp. YN15]|uniref:site-2 protease family protein n=1 Tax=Paenibacillus sp. YN15 TaxID=1742774 RepID=UPI000DCC3F51|nr:site-2 protease family protein [Paenibacillus sp. YN15]RAU94201.1 site-2 protease family protein [Paenibacillus sp. YN15]